MRCSPCSSWATGLGPSAPSSLAIRSSRGAQSLQRSGDEAHRLALSAGGGRSHARGLCGSPCGKPCQGKSFLRPTEFHHTLRLCNAYPGREASERIKPLAALAWQVFQVQLGGQNLTKGLAYKV